MRALFATLLLAMPAPALAFECTFTTECYEAEACGAANFSATFDLAAKGIATDFGDLTIVAIKQESALITAFATGVGAEYLVSITPTAARLTTHANDGPQVISYLGKCEGAF